MPATKKEVKPEEPLFVDEEGSYVHEAEQARYRGGVRRYTQAGGAAAAAEGCAAAATAGAGANARATSPSSSTKNTGSTSALSSSPGGDKGGEAATAAGNSLGGAAVASDGSVLFRHGRGTYTCPTFTYEGEWEEDEMHGRGQLTFHASGSTYTGAFAHGCFSGQGTYRWRDGAVYAGQWRANRMHGEGVYTDAEGHIWEGRYYNGTGPGLMRLYPTLERTQGIATATVTAEAAGNSADVAGVGSDVVASA
ncbi:hypothetical protein N2W54_002507 [Lotmaria passim]